jgi:hypothetical protein
MIIEISARNAPIHAKETRDTLKALFVTGAFYGGENFDPVTGRDD